MEGRLHYFVLLLKPGACTFSTGGRVISYFNRCYNFQYVNLSDNLLSCISSYILKTFERMRPLGPCNRKWKPMARLR